MNNEDDVTIEPEEGNKKASAKTDTDSSNPEQEDVVMEDESEPIDQIKKLKEKLKKALSEKQEYLDGWQKERAEFLNARKRDEKEKQEFVKFANENLASELLPVLDSFSMAFSNKEAWEKVDKNWRVGVEYIANQLKKILEDAGLKEIDPIGQKFDPARDEAVEFEAVDDESKNHMVTAVLHKGYSYNGRILKAPKVKVGEYKAK